jgi:hypothetical protein
VMVPYAVVDSASRAENLRQVPGRIRQATGVIDRRARLPVALRGIVVADLAVAPVFAATRERAGRVKAAKR